MTLQDYTEIGTYSGVCYKNIVADLELEAVFETLTGTPVEDYQVDLSEEDRLIHELLESAPDEYLLYSDVIKSEINYAILKVD